MLQIKHTLEIMASDAEEVMATIFFVSDILKEISVQISFGDNVKLPNVVSD